MMYTHNMLHAIFSLPLFWAVVAALDSSPSGSIGRSSSVISAAWYTAWHATDFPLSQVSWSKYTHMTYAFAVTTPDPNVLSLDDSDEKLLRQLVSTARQNNVKASLSIGGWTGSRWFSSNVGTAKNRTTFVNTVTKLAEQFQLDGLDFDWEFPGIQGIGCNVFNSSDTEKFFSFLQELRNTTTGKQLILSAAVFDTPWVDATGLPSTNISQFSQVLDYIAIMNYDVKSNPSIGAGSSSPLDDICAPEGARFGSAVSAVKAWTEAGMPANQIVLGVPAYGHSFVTLSSNSTSSTSNVTAENSTLMAYPAYNATLEKHGDKWDGDSGLDVCGVLQGPGGVYTYWGLMDEGFLNQDGSPAEGIEYRFDNCSQTPFVFNRTSGIYVSYDNPESFAFKGGFIKSSGLRGFAMWEAGGDSNDALLNSILNATQNGGPSSLKAPASITPASAPSGAMSLRLTHVLPPAWGLLSVLLLLLA